MLIRKCSSLAAALACALTLALARGQAQGVDVSVRVHQPANAAKMASTMHHAGHSGSSEVVVWLTPLQPASAQAMEAAKSKTFRLLQKDKQFTPHLLVVPTGASVEFPNKDPFFHNVFSLFNGKRFDLGLYESGTSRSVRFDREGVSYIFCNIHPEMGAIVLSVSTPFYAVSAADELITLRNVPPGAYRLSVWSETAQPSKASDLPRTVQVGSAPVRLDDVTLQPSSDPMAQHKNKFGEEYRPARTPAY